MFITFEGIDGSGKSTQIARTEAWLRERGYDVLVSREPGGSLLGEAIRDILLDPRWHNMAAKAEFFLYSASRAQLVNEIVRPHLAKPKAVVILDRYDDSSTAYQGGGRELGIQTIEEINRFATGGLVPDITFVLDLDWPTSCARRAKAGMENDRLERNAHDFFERARAAYHELHRRHPARMILLDGAQSADVLFAQIKKELEKRL
ncbi:dTMP kinase [candidate division KSB1 bacterium]|nr:MAG: dTMP kinase [candidate division KSB1 bacterium]